MSVHNNVPTPPAFPPAAITSSAEPQKRRPPSTWHSLPDEIRYNNILERLDEPQTMAQAARSCKILHGLLQPRLKEMASAFFEAEYRLYCRPIERNRLGRYAQTRLSKVSRAGLAHLPKLQIGRPNLLPWLDDGLNNAESLGSEFTDAAAEIFFAYLQQHCCNLQVLALTELRGLSRLPTALAQMTNLRQLNISYLLDLPTLTLQNLPLLASIIIENGKPSDTVRYDRLTEVHICELPALQTLIIEGYQGGDAEEEQQATPLQLTLHRLSALKDLQLESIGVRQLHLDGFKGLKNVRCNYLRCLEEFTLTDCRELVTLNFQLGNNLKFIALKSLHKLQEVFIAACNALELVDLEDLSALRQFQLVDCDDVQHVNFTPPIALQELSYGACANLAGIHLNALIVELPNLRTFTNAAYVEEVREIGAP